MSNNRNKTDAGKLAEALRGKVTGWRGLCVPLDNPYMNLKASEAGLKKLKDFIDKLADVPEEEWPYFTENLTG
ncbi:MAG: hypothetical protein BM485_03655 [Desulfobulbaceae bacterium DB1]|nr:MAG: hypothetical protein BM485_03655 [Desulfobulbaceae bacterium DB1]